MIFNAYLVDEITDDPAQNITFGTLYYRWTTKANNAEKAADLAYVRISAVVVNFSLTVFPAGDDPWSTLTLPATVDVTDKLHLRTHHPNARFLDRGAYRRH